MACKELIIGFAVQGQNPLHHHGSLARWIPTVEQSLHRCYRAGFDVYGFRASAWRSNNLEGLQTADNTDNDNAFSLGIKKLLLGDMPYNGISPIEFVRILFFSSLLLLLLGDMLHSNISPIVSVRIFISIYLSLFITVWILSLDYLKNSYDYDF